jgi:nitrogen-specific signal transduction histidine kinase
MDNKEDLEENIKLSGTSYSKLLNGEPNINNLETIQQIINSYPHVSVVLNQDQQIILSNQHLVKVAGLEKLEQAFGDRPGDVMLCIHSTENNGCGLSNSCRFCGIINTIKESQAKGITVTRECRITTTRDGKLVFHDFQVNCAPINLFGEHYTLLNLFDISSEKRNQILENVFFHDILNRLGGLTGLVQIIKLENKQPELDEYIDTLDTIGELVVEDIRIQRFLKAAENANLILNIREYSAFDIVDSVQKQIAFNPVLKSKKLEVYTTCTDFRFKTDSALLKRILLNMAINASEASPEKAEIKISCSAKPGKAVFSVNNEGTIPEDVQLQIFQRSFSTKGSGRGLGTYSMKLFGENYLQGRVYFRTNEKQGTTFTIELPLE